MSNITVTKLKFNEVSTVITGVDASNGVKIPYSNCDDSRMVLILENEAQSTAQITVKAGNAVQGVKDLILSVDGSKTSAVTLESGKYMSVSGDNKGYVTVTGAVKVSAVLLP